MAEFQNNRERKPEWLRSRLRTSPAIHQLKKDLREKSLNTVCESAKCPNLSECFSKKTATFLVMGDTCTRNCGFCAVNCGEPSPLNVMEPQSLVDMVHKMDLRHVVITSVTRDDLPDGGAEHFAKIIEKIKNGCVGITVEVLTPDFMGDRSRILKVMDACPDVFNHNLETVRRMTPLVRDPQASYDRSLNVLREAYNRSLGPPKFVDSVRRNPFEQKELLKDRIFRNRGSKKTLIKSGFMVGVGETDDEVIETLKDLKEAGCDIVTVGQYLSPSNNHIPVARYVEPAIFENYKARGEASGISYVFAGPMVRSSYFAKEIFEKLF